jgi:hypothetical protein
MKLLVVTSEPITAQQLREALPDGTDPQRSEVMVIAPALQEDALHFWLSDADEAIERAESVRRQTVDKLAAGGVPASGDTGESDPQEAIEDTLQTFSPDHILLFTHGEKEQRYREDVDPAEVTERFGVPAERVTVS